MKKAISYLFTAALFLNPLTGNSQEIEEQYNNTGQTFYDWCKDYPNGSKSKLCQGYLSSAALLLESGTSSAGPDIKICPPEGVEFDDMVPVFMAHMDANSELLKGRGMEAVTAAWLIAYPCD